MNYLITAMACCLMCFSAAAQPTRLISVNTAVYDSTAKTFVHDDSVRLIYPFNRYLGTNGQEHRAGVRLCDELQHFAGSPQTIFWLKSKEYYEYTANHKVTRITLVAKDNAVHPLKNVQMTENIYTAGNLQKTLVSIWDSVQNKWQQHFQSARSFNTANNVTQIKYDEDTGSGWQHTARELFQYNFKDEMTYRKYEDYNAVAMNYVPAWAYSYSYRPSGQPDTTIEYVQDTANKVLAEVSRTIWGYDPADRESFKVMQKGQIPDG